MSHRIKITDFMAPELDVYARLTENQLLNRAHPEEGMFIAESPKVIERAHTGVFAYGNKTCSGRSKRNDRKMRGYSGVYGRI